MISAYNVLGVESTADKATINAAFRKAVKRYHPDLNPDNSEAEAYLRQLLSARAEIEKARQRRGMQGRQAVRSGVRGREILVAASTFAAASCMSLALLISLGHVPPVAFEMRTVQVGEWSTVLQDQSERPAPKR